jgi:hypothetical protein
MADDVLELTAMLVGANGFTAGIALRLVEAKLVPSPFTAETLTRYEVPRIKPVISVVLPVATPSVNVVQDDPLFAECSIT